MNKQALAAIAGLLTLQCACTSSNNLLFGHVEAQVGTHRVAVTDCYRTQAPSPEHLTGTGFHEAYRYVPCKDAVVEIKDEVLRVNDRDYGRLHSGDSVLVDHGVVSIQRAAVISNPGPIASRQPTGSASTGRTQ